MKEEKKMKNAVMEIKELELEELAMVAGGNVFDDIACAIGEHDLELDHVYIPHFENGHQIDYDKYVCSNCKKAFYYKYDYTTGKSTKISREEFEAHTW